MTLRVPTNNIEPELRIDRRSDLNLTSVSLFGLCAACKNPTSNILRADVPVKDKTPLASFKIGTQLYTYRKLFKTLNGEIPYGVLLAETDPNVMQM